MVRILVPMDFTEVSLNALEYAVKSNPTEKVTIVHVAPMNIIEDPSHEVLNLDSNKLLQDELLGIAQDHLRDLNNKTALELIILNGDIISGINNLLNSRSFDTIYVGTRDKYDFYDRWVGSISFGLAKITQVPIYLIPRYAKFEPYQKIMVASDYNTHHTRLSALLNNWKSCEEVEFSYLYIKNVETTEVENRSDEETQYALRNNSSNMTVETPVIYGKNLGRSLLNSAYNYQADLMVILSNNLTFLDLFLYKSLSKDLILKSAIPILFLDKQKQL